jgi:ketosteroid isomerase-like protein
MTQTATAPESTIEQLSEKYNKAIQGKDREVLEEVLAENFVFIANDGTVMDKGQVIKFFSDPSRTIESLKTSSMKRHVYQNFAVETGRFVAAGTRGSRPFSYNFVFTSVWAKHDGNWQLINEHESGPSKP